MDLAGNGSSYGSNGTFPSIVKFPNGSAGKMERRLQREVKTVPGAGCCEPGPDRTPRPASASSKQSPDLDLIDTLRGGGVNL